MPERFVFDYAVVRVVPRVERGEFLNAGVIVFCPTQSYLAARIAFDRERLLQLDPSADCDTVRQHLDVIPRVCAGGVNAGPIGELPQRARFHWLVAPRSTIIQTSAVHAGVDENLNRALDTLFARLVERPVRS